MADAPRARHFLPLPLAALMALAAQPATEAAVRVCKDPVASDLVTDANEVTAKMYALRQWQAKAAALGAGYTSWRLAADKFLQCLPGKGGGFECIARAAPCTIDQAPARRELRDKPFDMCWLAFPPLTLSLPRGERDESDCRLSAPAPSPPGERVGVRGREVGEGARSG